MDRDIYLVKRVGSSEAEVFAEIVRENKKKIFYLAFDLTGSPQDAEDLSQEVFLKAFRALKTFKGEASIGSWLYRITLNTFLDRKRKLSFQAERDQQSLEEEMKIADLAEPANPENYAESQQIKKHIEAALTQLSPRERAVFVMRHYQDMPGKEVGKLLNISEGTVKSLLFRAIKKLQKQLSIYRDIPGKEVYQ
ncbi:MAG: RNA polymerase sigma factor [Candidatus Aminicenantes bacterium]|nr:MAG: RNA polymerase sigma factor [Candidatus Aminicenantes bacterium]